MDVSNNDVYPLAMNLKSVVEEFAERIQGLLEAQATEKARAEILGAFGMGAPRKPGRPPKTAVAVSTVSKPVAVKTRRKLPPQYCPVPYCRNVAAPIFGMVCAKHKDVPKAKIKVYREARRAKKLGLKAPKARVVVRKKRRPAAKKAVSRKRRAARKSTDKKVVAKKGRNVRAPRARAVVPNAATVPPSSTPSTDGAA